MANVDMAPKVEGETLSRLRRRRGQFRYKASASVQAVKANVATLKVMDAASWEAWQFSCLEDEIEALDRRVEAYAEAHVNVLCVDSNDDDGDTDDDDSRTVRDFQDYVLLVEQETRIMRYDRKKDDETKDEPIVWTVRVSTARVMRVRSMVDNPRACIMIGSKMSEPFWVDAIPDTGATCCVVPSGLMHKNGVVVDPSEKLVIKVANGHDLLCNGVANLEMTWLHHKISVVAYVSPDVDAVLISCPAMLGLGMIPPSFPFSIEDDIRCRLRVCLYLGLYSVSLQCYPLTVLV
eukprot:TCALIF_10523-PA protein Name:"Protein of unknown function" AED:0.36 eAED:0.43 QI:0/0/0/0.33/1/1/3/0/291